MIMGFNRRCTLGMHGWALASRFFAEPQEAPDMAAEMGYQKTVQLTAFEARFIGGHCEHDSTHSQGETSLRIAPNRVMVARVARR